MSRRLLTFCAAWLAALGARPAVAQEAAPSDSGPTHRRHLLQATVRGGGAWLGGDIDDHYARSGVYAGLGVGYSLATRGVDLGGGFDFLAVPDPEHPRRAYLPTLSLRFHVPLSDAVEFGLGLRAGWSWVTMADVRDDSGRRRDHTFSGVHLGLLPHARLWLAPRLALDLGAELLVAGGGDNLGSTGVRTTYLERSAHVGAFGAFARVNFGL
ncbi:MAG: hypothetical protein EOO73_29060 [Myxococcales bacterium]|nr:MAG: hypothetical protein EOO73_29060 [Myxococcales bacterium]